MNWGVDLMGVALVAIGAALGLKNGSESLIGQMSLESNDFEVMGANCDPGSRTDS